MKNLLRRLDGYQQRRRWSAFPVAVVKKFGDDRAGNLAALIAYYGFFSLFPLLLVMVSVLGLVLRGHPDLQRSVINSTLAEFPVIGDQLRQNIKALTGGGAGVALGVGTLLALWAGLGVTNAAQNAFNDVWNVPLKERPNFAGSRVRGLIMLVTLGIITLAAAFLSGLGTGPGAVMWLRFLGIAATFLLNVFLYVVAFRVLTDRDLTVRDVLPGALVGAVAWTLLLSLGGYYVQHQVKNASALYGFFGFVLVLLGWIYLGAQFTLLAAEVNVVRKSHLWPRSLLSKPPLTPADRHSMTRSAKVEERIEEEDVDVAFEEGGAAIPQEALGREPAPRSSPDGRRDNGGFLRSAAVGAGLAVAAGVAATVKRRRGSSPPRP